MIKYTLRCEDCETEFEGWFANSADFDAQAEAGLLECPACASSAVRKAIMAPAVRSSRAAAKTKSEQFFRREMAQAARKARDYVEKNFDYVGEKFPEEARRIHYGETPERGIYGEASGREVKELREEGVSVAPLPGTNAAGKPKKALN